MYFLSVVLNSNEPSYLEIFTIIVAVATLVISVVNIFVIKMSKDKEIRANLISKAIIDWIEKVRGEIAELVENNEVGNMDLARKNITKLKLYYGPDNKNVDKLNEESIKELMKNNEEISNEQIYWLLSGLIEDKYAPHSDYNEYEIFEEDMDFLIDVIRYSLKREWQKAKNIEPYNIYRKRR